MHHTREELIDILDEITDKTEEFNKNTRKVEQLNSQIRFRRFILLGLIIALLTLIPFFILNYIEGQNNETLTIIFFSVLPAYIPGFRLMFGVFYFGFLLLFIYGIFSIGRKNSFLYKIKYFRRLQRRIKEKNEEEINELSIMNEAIITSSAFSVISQQYSGARAISKLREYLINKRANNIPEAIELYELELHRERQINMQAATLASARRTEEYAEQAEVSAKKAEQSAYGHRRRY